MIFDETLPSDKFINAILASAAIPYIFPTIDMDGKTLIDGGAFSDLDLSEAILKCRDLGFSDS